MRLLNWSWSEAISRFSDLTAADAPDAVPPVPLETWVALGLGEPGAAEAASSARDPVEARPSATAKTITFAPPRNNARAFFMSFGHGASDEIFLRVTGCWSSRRKACRRGRRIP